MGAAITGDVRFGLGSSSESIDCSFDPLKIVLDSTDGKAVTPGTSPAEASRLLLSSSAKVITDENTALAVAELTERK